MNNGRNKSKEIQGVGAVKDRRYRTISTYDNGLKKTVTQQIISKDVYDERFLTTPTLVTDDNGKYFVTVRDGDNDTIYADPDFQKEYAKTGNTSLKNQLGLEQLNALEKDIDVPRNILQQQLKISPT